MNILSEKNTPRNSLTLRKARDISSYMSKDSTPTVNKDISQMLMQWGQFVQQDLVKTFTSTRRVEIINKILILS